MNHRKTGHSTDKMDNDQNKVNGYFKRTSFQDLTIHMHDASESVCILTFLHFDC